MHANTFRRAPLGGGPLRPVAPVPGEEPTPRMSATSVLLVTLALLGVVVTIVFGIWMIDFVQP